MVNAKKAREERRAEIIKQNSKLVTKERNWFAIWTSISAVVVIIAIALVVTIANINEQKVSQVNAATMTPVGVVNDGFVTGKDGAIASTAEPYAIDTPLQASSYDREAGNNISIYFDGACPHCKEFDEANGPQIEEWVNNGVVDTVTLHPLAFLSNYSLDTGNAMSCVAEYSPEHTFDAQTWLISNPGASSKAILEGMRELGAVDSEDFTKCIRGGKYNKFVEEATMRAQTGPVPASAVQSISGTPTILVNGERYSGDPTPEVFASFVEHVTSGGTASDWAGGSQEIGEVATEVEEQN